MNSVHLLIVIAFLGLLTGCAAPVIVAGGAAASTAEDERSTATVIDDGLIEAKAKDAIYNDSAMAKKIHVNVTSYNRVVLLTGETLNKELRDRVVDIVRRLDGVRRVHNEIRVADLTGFQSRANDTWLTSKIRAQMIARKGFDSSSVKITTENGTVFLMGLVTRAQGKVAADIARNVEGVKRVVKIFEYLGAPAT
jgi:osmotically-inducible protein OsmY